MVRYFLVPCFAGIRATYFEILHYSYSVFSSSRGSSAVTAMGTIAFSEKTMLAVKRLTLSKEDNAPSLDDFDRELEVYRVSVRLHISICCV